MNMLTAILPFAIILIILAFGYSLIKFGKKSSQRK
jgi:flagellar biogenesis protein FliO